MPFKKGQSGNAQGRAIDKPWRDALRKAVHDVGADGKTKKLTLIARRMADDAITGDVQAAKEIGDRLDGRAAPSPEEREDTKALIVQLVKYRGAE